MRCITTATGTTPGSCSAWPAHSREPVGLRRPSRGGGSDPLAEFSAPAGRLAAAAATHRTRRSKSDCCVNCRSSSPTAARSRHVSATVPMGSASPRFNWRSAGVQNADDDQNRSPGSRQVGTRASTVRRAFRLGGYRSKVPTEGPSVRAEVGIGSRSAVRCSDPVRHVIDDP